MKNTASQWLKELLVKLGIEEGLADQMEQFITLLFIIIIVTIIGILLRIIFLAITKKLLVRFPLSTKANHYIETILKRIVNIILFIIVFLLLPAAFDPGNKLLVVLLKACVIGIIVYILTIINTLLKIGYDVISKKKRYKQRPIKGFLQILQITVYFIGAIIIIATIINKSPAGLLTGLGAFAAVLSFIFKDTILGFISGIQLSYNDMVKPGDWITVNNSLANGVVVDISLITVKVQNFDNTIVNVPTYSLITTPFQNWRGMEESGGRRITLTYNIDMLSVRFCTPTDLERYQELIQIPKEADAQITNLELYRMYLLKMILNNPQINKELTLMVRYLQAGPEGIPIQIYCFSKNKSWVTYEGIQAAVLEQAVAMAGVFQLTLFQTVYKNLPGK